MSVLRHRTAAGLASLSLLVACHGKAPRPRAETSASATTRAAPTATAASSARASSVSSRPAPSADVSGSPTASAARELTWHWEDSPVGEMVVVVRVPETREPLPVLVVMHGLGESRKGPQAGARGWLDDYHLGHALERIAEPPLTEADYQGLGGALRRRELSARLADQPYRGLILVMPYTPDILEPDRSLDGADALGRFFVDELLPKVHRQTPSLTGASATGIDGVSLGGRAALLVGLAHPDRFGVVGSMQAAVYPHEVDALTERVRRARAANPALRLRLLTSSADFYRGTLGALSRSLKAADLTHRFVVVEGPHDDAFNRGPGAYELLTFHDRALRTP